MKKASKLSEKITKLVVLLLALTLTAAFAACGKAPADKPEVTEAPTAKAATQPPAATEKPTAAPTQAPTEAPTAAPATNTEPGGPTPEPPAPFFDLGFGDGDVFDAVSGRELWMEGGEVGEFSVNHNGKSVKVKGYYGSDPDSYITIDLSDFADFTEFVGDGVTYEIFLQIENIPSSSGGLLISNGNGGGTNMAIRGSLGQINFNAGSTAQDGTYCGSGYVYAQTNDASDGETIEDCIMEHVLGVYDPVNGLIKLYHNGALVEASDIGSGEFRWGGSRPDVLGIAWDPSSPGERLGSLTEFTIVKARVYRQVLTDEEVKAAYDNCVALVSN
ncbi:MAG: hypothetical protein J6V14_08000 [Clostridia bacterium]|nr:hypothetical protein [Clostridia bacterium]